MAMGTQLFPVTEAQIEKLRAKPNSITKLPADGMFLTHYLLSINYFALGKISADTDKNPLAAMLVGFDSVECDAVETGIIGIVKPAQVKPVLEGLEKLNLDKIAKRVEAADVEDLESEDVDDFELLLDEAKSPKDQIVAQLRELTDFYRRAAMTGHGVVMFSG